MTGSTLPFHPSGTVTIAATTTTTSAALTPGDTVLVYNASAAIAFVAFGNGAATATPAGYPIPPGGTRIVSIGPVVNYAAVILSAGTGNVLFSSGTGTPF